MALRKCWALPHRLSLVETKTCPLCGTLACHDGMALSRLYCACNNCDLRFIPPGFHLSPEQEYNRYLLHQNSLSDEGYVQFLMVAVKCVKTYLHKKTPSLPTILDFGSGPSPVLVQLLNQEGFRAMGYDPLFGNQVVPGVILTASLEGQGPFDAVVSTEAVEHFRNPLIEWAKMTALIRPGGLLVVMTSLVLPETNLSSWYYAKDPTHIAFYSTSTFRYIGDHWGLSLVETNGRNWVVMRKNF